MRWALLVAAWIALPAWAQNGILLVAKPDMPDPNFKETVVVVARAADASTVGVILNRPGERLLTGWPGAENYPEPLYRGGPVMPQVVIALFAAETEPKEASFQVLPNIYLTMHPKNIGPLLERPREKLRLFSGFSGWAPRQLESEMATGSWYALRATESVLFRKDTSGLWRELVEQARGSRTSRDSMTPVAAR